MRTEGRPQGGMKSEMGKAAYWRMNNWRVASPPGGETDDCPVGGDS